MADKPAFGVFPQMKPKRSQQDREAAKNVPVDLARGFVSGTLGAPGDLEALARIPYDYLRSPTMSELVTGDKTSKTFLPTSEDIEKRLPFRSDTPVSRAATGLGQLGGGAYTGPLSGARAATSIPKAFVQAGRDFVHAAGQSVSPLTVYHGSPHKFKKFDSSKIGTGEGAQAYGHGLYLAESEDIAKSYRNKLNDPIIDSVKADLYEIAGDPQWSVQAFDKNGKLIPKAKGYLSPDEIAKHYGDEVANLVLSSKYGGHFKNLGIQEGALYKVDLPDEKIARMLDWDKPLSEQPEVIKALKGTDYEVGMSQKEAEKIADMRLRQEADEWAEMTGGDPVDYSNNVDWEKYVDQVRKESGSIDSSTTGNDLHRMVMRDQGYRPDLFDTENYQVGTSEALRGYGIPGIKYLDATSRDAGKGTRNFVVFPGEEDALTILDRKKEGGVVGMKNGGEVKMDKGGAAFGVLPQMKGRRSKQDPEAAKNVPVDLARGFVSGALGMPGDLEGLARLLMNIQGPDKFVIPRNKKQAMAMLGQIFGADRVSLDTKLPTSEDIEKRLPLKSDTPVSQAATGLGQIVGGFYNGPMSGARAMTAIPEGIIKGGRDFVMAAGQPAVNVVKPKGGNFLTDRLGHELEYLKSPQIAGETPAQRIPRHQEFLQDPTIPAETKATVQRHLDEEIKRDAIDQWVDRNLTNYIKNQMATPEDPVRLMLDKRTGEIEAKFAKDMERADRLAKRAAAETDPRMKANLTRNAEQSKTAAEMERDLATKHLLPNQQVLMGNARQAAGESRVNRAVEGFPEEGMAKSPAGKAWEDITDSDMGVSANRAGDAQSAVEKKQKIDEALAAFYAKQREVDEAFIKQLAGNGMTPAQIQYLERGRPTHEKAELLHNLSLKDEYKRLESAANDLHGSFKGKDLKIAERYPWVEKLDPETRIYEFYGSEALGFHHILDVLKQDVAAGRITAEQLNRMSVDQAVRRAAEYDKELAEKMNSARAAAREGLPVYKEYPEGYRWVELNKPGSFASESEAMGHSVRGYEPPKGHPDWVEGSGDSGYEYYGHGGWEGIKSGKAKVYSLVDPKGAPHVTVEIGSGKLDPRMWYEAQPQSVRDAIDAAGYRGYNIRHSPQFKAADAEAPPTITQIKGKQNARPNEKYDQYTQDFVKSGNWSDVRDLDNTGLIKIDPESDLAKGLAARGSPVPSYASQNEITDLLKQAEVGSYSNPSRRETFINPDHPGWADDGMKRGGRVSISDNADSQMMDVLDKKLAGGGEVYNTDPDMSDGGRIIPGLAFAGGGLAAKLAKLARAPAKSAAEIEAIAQRMAPQVTGEFVRGDKGTTSVAGKTQKQFAREKELPVDFTDIKNAPPIQTLNPEKLQGSVVTGIPGDPTVTGRSLTRVGDIKLDSPSPQHGGPLYGLHQPDDVFWASGIGPAGGVQRVAKEAMEAYDAPVLGQYIMMGPDSINYAQHFADANLSAIDLSKMSKKQIEQFNKIIRFGDEKSGPRPTFPGIENKEEAYLHLAFDPHLRRHFNKLMQMPTVTEPLNLPSGQDIRFATTEPSLRDLETGVTGFSMGKLNPEVSKSGLKLSSHPTYSHDIPGEFMGGMKYPVPYELSFPDTLKSVRENPSQAGKEFGSLKMVGPRQIYDQQMVDELKQYEEAMKRLTGKKKGGSVNNGLIKVKNKRKARG